MRLREIAERLECRLEGDGDIEIRRLTGIEQAGPGDLTFLANTRYSPLVTHTRASAIILGPGAADAPCAVLRCQSPYQAFACAVPLFYSVAAPPDGVDVHAAIAPDARIGSGVSIGPFVAIASGAVIGARTTIYPGVTVGAGARVGEDCVLHAHVSIREHVVVGDRVIVQDGAVIGSDGFGFVKLADGTHRKIPQHASVVIEDDVEVGANTTIDRPAIGETRVKAGAKIDNLVQIAHGVTIGRDALLAAQVGVAGSTTIGDSVTLAGQVGVAGHLTIGQGTVATAQTGIPNSLEEGAFVSGYPAIANRDWLKASALFRRLPAMRKRLADLEEKVAALEGKLPGCAKPTDRS